MVALIGAGNSAGQATVYLASKAAKVWLLVRGPDLAARMSRYLVDRIASQGPHSRSHCLQGAATGCSVCVSLPRDGRVRDDESLVCF